MKQHFPFLFIALFCQVLSAQSPKEKGFYSITDESVKAQLEFLSSDWTEGRATGTRGAYMASDYIASMFSVYGLKPGGDEETTTISRRERMEGKRPGTYRTYFQKFPLMEYKAGEDQQLSLVSNGKSSESVLYFNYRTDFSVSPGPVSMEGRSEIVFVGYGYYNEENEYDDYSKIDVKNKIIIRLSGYPGHMDTTSAAYQKFHPKDRRGYYTLNRNKNERAMEKGVMAILEVNPVAGLLAYSSNIPFRYNTDRYEGDRRQESFYDSRMTYPGDSLDLNPPVFYISMRMANEIFAGAGINLSDFEKSASANPEPQSKTIKDKQVRFKTDVESRIIQARNVIGVLEGKDPDEIIVVGAHYDHLGIHDGYIWNGADDNASGTVGVMAIARACMETGEKPEKTIVFAAWTGEEKGLWGSKYFTSNPYMEKKIILNLNFDMISRDDADDKEGKNCRMTYTSGYKEFEVNSEDNIEAFDLELNVNYRAAETAPGGSDHAPFAEEGIPYFYFMAGFPPEYHQSNDQIELVNIPKMANIIRLGYLNIWDFANSEKWRK